MSWLYELLAGKIGQEYARGAVREEALRDRALRDGAGARADALAASKQLDAAAAIHPAFISEHAVRHAFDLGDRGDPVAHLLQAVVAQAGHPFAVGDRLDVVNLRALEDQAADLFAHGHHLVHAYAPAIARAAAARAADRLERLGAGQAMLGEHRL